MPCSFTEFEQKYSSLIFFEHRIKMLWLQPSTLLEGGFVETLCIYVYNNKLDMPAISMK